MLAIRGLWVLSPLDSSPVFERRFISVETRARKLLGNYIPVPNSTLFIDALLVEIGIKKSDFFVPTRDGCDKNVLAPAFEVPTENGNLGPIVLLQHRGLLICALPLCDWSNKHEKKSFFNVAQTMDCLTMLAEQLNNDITQKSALVASLQRFVSIAMPFGQPTGLSSVLVEQMFNSATKDAPLDKIKRPAWNTVTLKGKSYLHFHIIEHVYCEQSYSLESYNSMVTGTVWISAGEVLGDNSEISVTLSHPTKLSSLTLAPRAQTTVQSDEATTIAFHLSPASKLPLCHYSLSKFNLPINGKLDIQKGEENMPSTLHFTVQKTTLPFSKLEFNIGPHSSNSIKSIKTTVGSVNEENETVHWELPPTKLRTKGAELEMQFFYADQEVCPYHAKVCFKMNQSISGCKISPQSVMMSPQSKVKCTFGSETTSVYYNLYPHKDVVYPRREK